MRVLHLLASRSAGGAEILVRDLAIELRSKNVEVGIAFISRAADLHASPEFEARYQQMLDQASISTFDLGHECRRNPVLGAIRLNRLLKLYRPDILHIHLEFGLLYRLLLWPRKIASVYTHHIDRFRRGRRMFRLLSLTVDRFVAISRQGESLLRPIGGDRVIRIVNAVRFESTSRPRVPGRLPLRILSVGGLHPQKNYGRHLRTVATLLKRRPELVGQVLFEIAGDGPDRPKLMRQIASLGLDSVVALLGTRTDVHELMMQSDLLLMTSDYEGLPLALIEAVHAGLPIVATNVGGVSDVVEHEGNGFLLPVDDVPGLADHLLRLIDEPELRTRFARVARRKARQFMIQASADQHLALYHSVVVTCRGQPHGFK